MDSKKRGTGRWMRAGLGVLVLLGVYVEGYYAMVRQVPRLSNSPSGPPVVCVPVYGPTSWWGLHPVTRPLFWPMNQLDRKLRPHVWTAML